MRKRRGLRCLAGTVLALAVGFSAIPTVPAKASTPGMTEEQKWQELQNILPEVTGRYTEAPNKDSVSGTKFTAGMLLGNGSLGVVSDARHGEQSFYISTADGYVRTSENRKITNAQLEITDAIMENSLEVTTNDRSTNASDKDQGPGAVIDKDPLTYWVSNPTSRVSGPKWLVFTFSKAVTIDSWSSIHRGYMDTGAGYHNPRYNTRDFCLQTSEDGKEWSTVDDIVGNSDYTVERTLSEPVTSRYFRIYITKPVQLGQETASVTGDRETARISEVDFLYKGKSVIHVEKEEATQPSSNSYSYSQSDSNGFNGSASGAFDGNPYTYWRSNNQLATGEDKPKTIAVTSKESFTFNELEILHFGSRYPDEPQYNTYDFEVQVQQDGEWKTLKNVAGNVENVSHFTFDQPVTATGLRLYITKPVHPDYATKHRTNDMTFAVIYDINILMNGAQVLHSETEDDTYLHEQDVLNAEVRSKQIISGEQFYFTSWVERDKNILVTDVKLDEKAQGDTKLTVKMMAPNTSGTSTKTGAADDLLYVTREGALSGNESNYRFRVATVLKVLSDKYTVKGGIGELTLSPGETVRMITYSHTSAGTVKNGLSYKEVPVLLTEAQEYLNNAANTSEAAVAQAREDSRGWWKEYWLQSYIDIDDEILQRYYYGALYGLGSTIRPTPEGAEQPNLPSAMYGVWQTNDSPGSGGRAYLNYNYEAPYYGLHSSNRSYIMEPYYDDVTKRLSYVQENTAKNGYNGASIVRNICPVYSVFDLRTDRTTVAGTKKPTGSGFADQKTNTMLYTQALLWDWQYNKDEERLTKYIYNTVRDAVIFYIDFVTYNEKDGKYWIYKSASNERDGYDYDTNPTIDIGYIQSHFRSFMDIIEEASELGITGIDTLKEDKENLIPKMQHILDNLVEYPTNINNQETADDLESKGFEYDLEIIMSALYSNNGTQVKAGNVPWGMYIYEGNQPVPLEGLIHPAENVSLASDSNLLALVSDTFEYFNPLYPYYRGGGYNGFAKSYTMAARLGMDGDKLANHLASTIGALIRNNNTCMTSGHGIEVFGNVEAINSMLLQNENDELRVFPAWAKSKDAKFVDLRAKGAFLVSSEYKAGSGVEYVSIHSEKGNQVSFVAPWDGGVKVVDSKGNTVSVTRTLTENTAEFMYVFDTKAGETYTVTKEGGLPANTVKGVTLSIDSPILEMGETVQATYDILPADDTLKAVKFESSDTTVATVNNSGVICGRGAGTATITLSSVQDPSIQASVQIKVIRLEAPQNSITKYNNDAAGTSFTGTWTHHKNRPGAYNKDAHWSKTIGDSFEFTFTGTGVDFHSEKFNNCGKFEMWLNGTYVATYDNYLDVDTAQRDIVSCSVRDLEYGQHTIKLVVAEEAFFLVDAFTVYTEMGLDKLYEELSKITELKQSDYSKKTWDNYFSVWAESYDAYNDMMKTGETRDDVDELAAALKDAREALEEAELAADKTLLQKLYDEKKAVKDDGYTEKTWSAFQNALENAKAVLEDEDAQQEAVDSALASLQKAADELRKKVSKKTLEYYLTKAKAHVANGDVDGLVVSVQKLFETAIAEGEAVMANEDATAEEVTKATTKLMLAIHALNMKEADKTDLGMALELTTAIDLTKYVEVGQAEYLAAKEAAEAVMDDGDVLSQDVVDEAWSALVEAIANLRLKADKATLEALLNSVKDLDLSLYTEESVAVFRTALARANEVMADEALSEDDQKVVDQAVKALADAKDALKLKDTGATGDDNKQDGDDRGNGNQTSAPKTGDDSVAVIWGSLFAVIALAGAAICLRRRKSR